MCVISFPDLHFKLYFSSWSYNFAIARVFLVRGFEVYLRLSAGISNLEPASPTENMNTLKR